MVQGSNYPRAVGDWTPAMGAAAQTGRSWRHLWLCKLRWPPAAAPGRCRARRVRSGAARSVCRTWRSAVQPPVYVGSRGMRCREQAGPLHALGQLGAARAAAAAAHAAAHAFQLSSAAALLLHTSNHPAPFPRLISLVSEQLPWTGALPVCSLLGALAQAAQLLHTGQLLPACRPPGSSPSFCPSARLSQAPQHHEPEA